MLAIRLIIASVIIVNITVVLILRHKLTLLYMYIATIVEVMPTVTINTICISGIMIVWSCRFWASHTLRSWLYSHQSHLDMLRNKRHTVTSGKSYPSVTLASMLLG